MDNIQLQQRIARIRATGATYEEALQRISMSEVANDRHTVKEERQAKNVARCANGFIPKQAPLAIGGYRRRKK